MAAQPHTSKPDDVPRQKKSYGRRLRRQIFPRRDFQDRLIKFLREEPGDLSKAKVLELVGEDTTGNEARDLSEARAAILELRQQRMILCDPNWQVGGKCVFNPKPDDRWYRLPDWPEPNPWMKRCGAILFTAAALFFFIFHCFYLPHSWIVPVTGTATLLGALLGYAGLKLSDTRALSALRWTIPKLFVTVVVTGLLFAFCLVGWSNPCRVDAPPGATITVDGKTVLNVPPLPPDAPTAEWLKPQRQLLHLRWDPHEIRVFKRWHVADEGWESELQAHVSLDWSSPLNWVSPQRLFARWEMPRSLTATESHSTAESSSTVKVVSPRLVPSLRIVPVEAVSKKGFVVNPSNPSANLSNTEVRNFEEVAEAWDSMLQAALSGHGASVERPKLTPHMLTVQLRKANSDREIVCALFNPKGEMLQPLRPFPVRQVPSDLEPGRVAIFEQLERLLRVGKLVVPQELVKSADAILIKHQLTDAAEQAHKEPEKSAGATASALTNLAANVAETSASGVGAADAASAMQKGAEVAQEALKEEKGASAATVAEKIADVGTTAAEKGNVKLAQQAQSSLQQIATTADNQKSARTTEEQRGVEEQTVKIKKAEERVIVAIAQAKELLPRVYLHIANEGQRSRAQELLKKSNEEKYDVMGIQNVLGRAYIPATTEVRYFAPEAEPLAKEIARRIRDEKDASAGEKLLTPSSNEVADSRDIKGHLEVWFSRDSPAVAPAND